MQPAVVRLDLLGGIALSGRRSCGGRTMGSAVGGSMMAGVGGAWLSVDTLLAGGLLIFGGAGGGQSLGGLSGVVGTTGGLCLPRLVW